MALSEQTDIVEETESLTEKALHLAAIDEDLTIRENALEAHARKLQARQEALANAEDFAAAIRRAEISAHEERDSDASFREFMTRDETDVSRRQPLQSTILEENSQTTPGGNPQPAQRGRSRERSQPSHPQDEL